MILIVAFLASFIPSLAIFFWLRNGLKKDDPKYKGLCWEALGYGALCSFAVILVSFLFNLFEIFTGISDHEIVKAVFRPMVTLAFSEELVKFLTMKRFLKKNSYPYSWLDVTVVMILVGMGFGLVEFFPYAVGANVPTMLIRGITAMHAGYGFVMGRLVGKSMKTGKKIYAVLGFMIPWIMHGTYDMCLSPVLNGINDNIGMISLLLAVIAVIILIRMIIFTAKARKNPLYTDPLPGFEKKPEGESSR